MATDFDKTFGASSAAKVERKASEFWINVGYASGVANKAGEEYFVSLPLGIPLDDLEPVKATSSDPTFAAFQAGKNSLLEQIKAAAAALKPGESQTLKLEVQLRRSAGEKEQTVDAGAFARKII